MVLLLDNFDSFTYNLVDYFHQLGISIDVVTNDVHPDKVQMGKYKGLVLSPGPETPSKSGYLMEFIHKYHKTIPILGVCLGHQALGVYFGAKLVKAASPMHGKISRVRTLDALIFDQVPSEFNVVRYHSLVLEQLPACLAKASVVVEENGKEGDVMAVRHLDFPIWGLQYHPEAALTEYGLKVLRNWANHNGIH